EVKLRIDPLIPALPELLPDRGAALVAGCGYGIMTARLALARRELRLLALDSDPRKVEVARAALGRDLGVELVCADLRDPAAAEGPFDAVTCIDLLHYWDPPAQRALLGALVARLRPGGVLLLR